jgi:hypothetical protein
MDINAPHEWYRVKIADLKKRGGTVLINLYGLSLYEGICQRRLYWR